MENITWILTPNQFAESFDILFSENSELEADYDYIYITYQGVTNIYTSFDLAEELYESIDSTMIIQLISDQYLSDYYGFSTVISYDMQSPIELVGDQMLIFAVGETYNELGATILNQYQELYTLRIDGNIDTSVLGNQYVYYHLIDESNQIVYTTTRIVSLIVDNINPTFDEISNQTIEVGQTDIDWTTLIINADDNTNGSLYFTEQSDAVIYDEIGTYSVTVSVTDATGNVTVDTFVVTVVDTVKPIVSLNPSIDSIYVGDVYIDYGVNVIDSTQTQVGVLGTVDTTTEGIYMLTYIVTDEALNVTQIVRYVHVSSAKLVVTFTLGDAKTTLAVGEIYVDGDCTVNIGTESFTCEVKQNDVNINIPSIHVITYSYTYENVEYTYKRYVFVYGTSPLALQYKKEEELMRI
ncbi:MAG: hypothetical protein CVV58_05715 [Tenericutes bacterium HGW-Tenericutes-3]|nr:MAG: hypothetical protein CVV58_05715 [Tenericutes bacterium HGW-Tenericutes-3]